jgi:hypothetical protein
MPVRRFYFECPARQGNGVRDTEARTAPIGHDRKKVIGLSLGAEPATEQSVVPQALRIRPS